MSLSPARQHRLRVQAEQAAREGGSVRHASGYDLMLLQLAEDRRRLKGVQSTVKKAEIKVELLPKYAAWAEGVLAAGGAQQDDVLMYVMLWRIDAGDYAGALEIGRHALRHGWVMPLGNRNVQTVLAEEMADAAQSAMLAAIGFDADLLLQTLELTDGLDMPDQSRARLHKAIGAARREKSWHKTTVGEVVKEIAARHKLKMALGNDLSDKPVEHIDQTNESDGSFLMRLARQYGAIASVKNGNLLFIRQGQGKSASGKPLPVITITRKDGDSHRFTLADRGAYTGVIASWLHTREPSKKESTTVKRKRRTKKQKKEPEAKQGDYLVGTDENVLVLNRTYANRSNAERAAKMQWERLQRGVASFSLQLAEGRADLYTEMPVKVSGFKQPIDDAEWTITTLTHTVSPDNGFTTSLELEVRIDDFEME
ncbi:phage terminase small subunit [Escherichia coli]